MVKYVRDLKNKRAYIVIQENDETYTIDKGAIVGLIDVFKKDSNGKDRFKRISKAEYQSRRVLD